MAQEVVVLGRRLPRFLAGTWLRLFRFVLRFYGHPPPPAVFAEVGLDWPVARIRDAASGGVRVATRSSQAIVLAWGDATCTYELSCVRAHGAPPSNRLRFVSLKHRHLTYEVTTT